MKLVGIFTGRSGIDIHLEISWLWNDFAEASVKKKEGVSVTLHKITENGLMETVDLLSIG